MSNIKSIAKSSLTVIFGSLFVLAFLYSSSLTALGASPQAEQTRLIIQLESPATAQDAALVRGLGGSVLHEYSLVPAMAVEVPDQAIKGLENNPRVILIEEDVAVQAMAVTPITNITDEYGETWSITNVKAKPVHDGGNVGAGVKIGIIDSGISNTHPDLNVVGEYDFVNNSPTSDDVYGHGTHVAGTVCGTLNGFGVVGTAPGCELYDLRVLNDDGVGYTSDIIAAVDWAAAQGLDVINLSLGSSRDPGSTAQAAYDAAYEAGVLIVAAAGNSGRSNGRGTNTIYPANYESVIAVAATDSNDERAYFSSTGDNVELAAPGYSVHSAWNDSTSPYDPQPNCIDPYGCYKDGSGTSMASPQVAGVAALIIAAGITDTSGEGNINDEVRSVLQGTAVDLGQNGRDPQYGFGLVDAGAAVAEVVPAGPQAPVANAGADQTVEDIDGNGVESVTLDGTNSSDDGTITYSWLEEGVEIATGVSPTIDLALGSHMITLVVTDNTGATSSDSVRIDIIEPVPQPNISLSGTADKVRGTKYAYLNWTAQAGLMVDIIRDGANVAGATTDAQGDGAYGETLGKGGGAYVYQVCEQGTSNCSNEITLSF